MFLNEALTSSLPSPRDCRLVWIFANLYRKKYDSFYLRHSSCPYIPLGSVLVLLYGKIRIKIKYKYLQVPGKGLAHSLTVAVK